MLNRKLRMLQRNCAESYKAFRICRTRRRDVCVLRAHDFTRQIGISPIVILIRRRAERLHVYAHRIHIAQPLFQTRHFAKGVWQHCLHVVRRRSCALCPNHHFRFGFFLRAIGDERL